MNIRMKLIRISEEIKILEWDARFQAGVYHFYIEDGRGKTGAAPPLILKQIHMKLLRILMLYSITVGCYNSAQEHSATQMKERYLL